MGCPDISNPNSAWNFCPNMGAAVFFAILFGATMIAHIVQAIKYRKAYCWVIAMGALWQTLNYAFRIVSIKNPYTNTWYVIWFVLILLAPLWTNAFVYMVMGRILWNFSAKPQIWGIKAWRMGLYFVLLDITAFIVQAAGAVSASGTNTSEKTKKTGLDIYMAGVGFQQLFVLIFFGVAITFQRTMSQESSKKSGLMRLLYVEYAVLSLITMRIIFRLVEYSSGFKSTIPNHEAYQYCLDSLPMLVALVLFNIIHPGRIMPGKESDLPSRKARKLQGNFKSSEGGGADSAFQLDSSKDSGHFRETEVPTHGYVS